LIGPRFGLGCFVGDPRCFRCCQLLPLVFGLSRRFGGLALAFFLGPLSGFGGLALRSSSAFRAASAAWR
jgi:hypothetical protein